MKSAIVAIESTRAIDRVRWNMKHFRQNARASCCLIALGSALHALHLTRTREQRTMHGLVMTGHNARRPRTGRERGRWWRPSEASYLTVWTLNDQFFASPVHCMLRRVLSEYWRKETEKSKVFFWGGRFGRSLLCPGRAEKKTRGSCPPTGCLPVDRNQLGPDSWRDKKGVWYRTHRQTHRHTHGMKSAPLGLAGCQEWSLTTEALPVDGVVCLQSKHLRSIAGTIARPARRRCTRDRSRSRWNTSGKPQLQTARAVAWSHSAAHCMHYIWLGRENKGQCMDWSWPVTTMHDGARTGRERRPWWLPSEASYLTVWTLNDRFFASLVFCMVRRVLSEYWRKETENRTFFGGVVGLDGRCSAQAEQRKKPVAVVHLPGAYTCRQKQTWSRFVAWWERSLWPDTHAHTHAVDRARSPALARTWHPARIKWLVHTNTSEPRSTKSSNVKMIAMLAINTKQTCAM